MVVQEQTLAPGTGREGCSDVLTREGDHAFDLFRGGRPTASAVPAQTVWNIAKLGKNVVDGLNR